MSETDYGLSRIPEARQVAAPTLDYLPPRPRQYRPRIGLIGAGGISELHLRAYRRMELDIVAICDLVRQCAEHRAQQFYPNATVHEDYRYIIEDPSIEVVDIATHPEDRVALIEAAVRAGKHVLSQKPFVLDIELGRTLVQLADQQGVRLAVNQNGRWAPHFRYLTRAIQAGVIGRVASIDFTLQWDHSWTAGSRFEQIHHLLLYDYAIHWFDIVCTFLRDRSPLTIYARVARAPDQRVKPPFLAHAVIDYADAQVRLCLNAHVTHGQEDRTVIAGTHGTLRSFGPGLNEQQVVLWTEKGIASPQLDGRWFDNGFEGTMGELLCAIEEGREPCHSARDNLRTLQLCFAALKSADTGSPVPLG